MLLLKVLMVTFPLTDVVSIKKTGEHFRILYDVKGRFIAHRITDEEAKVRGKLYEPLYLDFTVISKYSCIQLPSKYHNFLQRINGAYPAQNKFIFSLLFY